MPRTARKLLGGYCYHVINRGNGRAQIFHDAEDYGAFVSLMARACGRIPIRLLAFCLMPNHFHFVLWPEGDRDISRWMHWLMTTHVCHYHRKRETSGRVWQGRFKAFPIEQDRHLLVVLRYVERNALGAGLVNRAESWPWCSLNPDTDVSDYLHSGPVKRTADWVNFVNQGQEVSETKGVQRSIRRDIPFGRESWAEAVAKKVGLESSLRSPGRPRKKGNVPI